MKPQLKNNEIEQILKVIKVHKQVEEAILFGSRATGKSKPNSDVDICLKGKEITSSIQNSISSDLDELPLPYFFDVINYTTLNNERLKKHITEQGINLLQLSDISIT